MLSDVRLDVLDFQEQFARHEARLLTPPERSAGFADKGKRGEGDFMDHLATLLVFDYLASQKCKVMREICAGVGDHYDIQFLCQGKWWTINCKASSWAPLEHKLHLFVKGEELERLNDAYVQVFIHLNEPHEKPHAHVAGYARRSEVLAQPLREIPNTNHLGVGVPILDLHPLENLVLYAD